MDFFEYESDFFFYMIRFGGISPRTSRDYLTRLRFLSRFYVIDSSITEDHIENIISQEKERKNERETYSYPNVLSDFHAGLIKFLNFINSDYYRLKDDLVKNQITELNGDNSIAETEKEAIILARKGQGLFRERLCEMWKGCSLTGCSFKPLLVASHIKPWSLSDNQERLDVYNGLLLLPNYDKLFDRGYMSFGNQGKAIFSSTLSLNDKEILGLDSTLRMRFIDKSHRPFLTYHRQNLLI